MPCHCVISLCCKVRLLSKAGLQKITDTIIAMPKVQEAIQAALNNCNKEQASGDKVRGDNILGMFENQ